MRDFQTVRGTRDLLPKEARRLRFIINKAIETAELYGYKEVITPVLESYELLNAKSGEEIRARMFKFDDLGGRPTVLRPEFTASIARLVTTSLKKPLPIRFFSVGTVYRYDEPQHGRYREFWQSNFELMGSSKPEADAEVILLTNRLMKAAGLRNYKFKLGHVGVLRAVLSQDGIDERTQNTILQRMDKEEYESALEIVRNDRCIDDTLHALFNLKEYYPLVSDPVGAVEEIKRIVKGYEKAEAAAENLAAILRLVTESGCEIKTTVNPAFARGLEYYTGMIFEVYIPGLNIALGGGGRYDKLIEVFGGEPTPAVGVAHGLDRIALAKKTQALQNLPTIIKPAHKKRVLIIPANQEAKVKALKIAELLREAKIRTEFEIMGRTIDKALKKAKHRKVDYAVIVGKPTLSEDWVVLQDLSDETNKEERVVNMSVSMLVEKLRSKK
jgi:histidyl-tRNA synthetase